MLDLKLEIQNIPNNDEVTSCKNPDMRSLRQVSTKKVVKITFNAPPDVVVGGGLELGSINLPIVELSLTAVHNIVETVYDKQRFPDIDRFTAAVAFALAGKHYYNTKGPQTSRTDVWALNSPAAMLRVVKLCYDFKINIMRPATAMAMFCGLSPLPENFQGLLSKIDRPALTRSNDSASLVNLESAGTISLVRRSRLHLAFLNPQGNFDAANTGFGEHADFGGQLVYVRELAQALGRLKVNVDIVTRRFTHPRWQQFDIPEEILSDGVVLPDGEIAGRVRILRIPAGPREFLRKEDLWPHLNGWAHNIRVLYECEGQFPHATIGNYADGGLAAARLRDTCGLPFGIFQGHSLGAQKIDGLLIENKDFRPFNFDQRINAERWSMSMAAHIVTSTHAERETQYGHPLYLGAISIEDIDRFTTIPPGINLDVFGVYQRASNEAATVAVLNTAIIQDIPPARRHLPIVVAAGRLDAKKNHINIVRAFAQNSRLRCSANLLFLLKGGKNAFRNPEVSFTGAELALARSIKKLLVSSRMQDECFIVPGLENRQDELAAVYRHLGRTKQGIFCLAADFEPFGLMPLEAMASGLPAVVTRNGGPSESLRCNGHVYALLVDPRSPAAIGEALYSLAANPTAWLKLRDDGQQWVLNQYNWERTATSYRDTVLDAIAKS
ncbi:MAG: hypothetical protein M1834_006850 [Cirrosporium novae-zelandiae]|nr:MAG: hypothetical protein M1834_006850 [Cirrosporium novae-zelandiae]